MTDPRVSWLLTTPPNAGVALHVLPVLDLVPHISSAACWCRPPCINGVYHHASADERECYEEGVVRPSRLWMS